MVKCKWAWVFMHVWLKMLREVGWWGVEDDGGIEDGLNLGEWENEGGNEKDVTVAWEIKRGWWINQGLRNINNG